MRLTERDVQPMDYLDILARDADMEVVRNGADKSAAGAFGVAVVRTRHASGGPSPGLASGVRISRTVERRQHQLGQADRQIVRRHSFPRPPAMGSPWVHTAACLTRDRPPRVDASRSAETTMPYAARTRIFLARSLAPDSSAG